MRILAVAALGLVLAAAPAAAQTFYVAATGNDASGDGSLGAPWATIRYALQNAPDGATVLRRNLFFHW